MNYRKNEYRKDLVRYYVGNALYWLVLIGLFPVVLVTVFIAWLMETLVYMGNHKPDKEDYIISEPKKDEPIQLVEFREEDVIKHEEAPKQHKKRPKKRVAKEQQVKNPHKKRLNNGHKKQNNPTN